MKSILLTALFISAFVFVKASDLIVEEFGSLPTYASITDAYNASVDGDRIIIKNRAGNIPWIETLIISKSLQFLSYDNDTFFVVQGNYSIVAAAGREVSFIGMRNTSGTIQYSGSPTGTKTTTVNIMDCYLLSGSIYFPYDAYNVNIASCELDNGYVSLHFGNITGSQITTTVSSACIYVSSSLGFNSDTVLIVGNKLDNQINSSIKAIEWYSTASIFIMRNNFIKHHYMGIFVNGCASAAGKQNLIYNNTISNLSSSFSSYGIDIANTPSGSIVEIMNNVLDNNGSSGYGINHDSGNSGQLDVYYNHADNAFSPPISTGWTFSGNNTTTSPVVLLTDGRLSAGSAAINGGNPAAPFYDLDLSAGDAGAYGASYTLDNFFPLFVGSARVYYVQYPFNVRQGATLNVKAFSFDR